MSPAALRPVWLDTDPGFDDWLSMLMLAVDTRVQWVGTSIVAGNAPLHLTLANALSIRQHFGLRPPVYAACAAPLRAPLETAQHVLGERGMRTRGEPLPEATEPAAAGHGVQALLDALRASRTPMTVLAIGPLTNLATALTRDPGAAANVGEVVLMGGSTERGNHTPAAEFNIHADPEAADIVFNAGLPVRMFGLNVCRQVLIEQRHVQELLSWPGQRARWLAGYMDAYQRIRSADGSVPMPLYDPVVTAWLAAPELFGFTPARVDIELHGRFTRGMTVCDFKARPERPFNAQVATWADGPAVLRLVMERLHHALVERAEP